MLRFVAFATLCILCRIAAAEGDGLNLNVQTSPMYPGVQTYLNVSFDKHSISDNTTYHAPFTLRIHAPNGTLLSGSNAGGGAWSCPSFGSGAQDIACTYLGTLTPTQWLGTNLSLTANVLTSMPLGATSYRVTVESAELPLPPTPTCTTSPSTTRCVDAAATVYPAYVEVTGWSSYAPGRVATWTGPPYEAGAQGFLEIDLHNAGYGQPNGPLVAKIKLPPGVTFDHTLSSLPGFTCGAQNQTDGQLVTCSTPYMYDGQTGFVSMTTNISYDVAVPGPIVFYAMVGNAAQTVPTNCAANLAQTGCAKLTLGTRPATAAYMRFASTPNDVAHSPHVFTLGEENGPIEVHFQNAGDGNAASTSLSMKLPPGFSYSRQLASLPDMACTSSGAISNGPIVTCVGAGLPAATSGFMSFYVNVDATSAAPGPDVIVGGIDASNPATPTTLTSCTSDPAHTNCFWHEVPTFRPCALQYGSDGVYCDGFQAILPQ